MRLEYFELVDRIEQLDLEQGRILARGNVPAASPVFEGHFPGHPLVPGVMLIEFMAQASGWLLLAKLKFERMAFLAAAKEAKFRDFVQPSVTLIAEANVEHDGSGYGITKCKIRREDGSAVADATITLRYMPFPSPDFSRLMLARAQQIGLPLPA
ncbi:MAG: beta-hydroxyacyl-ACP dehydratase [Xanthobacteraceae bacterium]|nr:beta-hydroxyacyl-ACP dehydratase [Xanthobacteraceae bacterium]QYK45903.1 MAG: beta-hydroxyacyl-ACP dehydratase [Xanthobacteraceae bacterium]HMN50866.1 3-hydroxyacyl-ACP dehydratase FabZ family protein [Xanthobacteraceae bacterium]